MLAQDSILENRYRIIGLLGQGGMGAIYEAEDFNLSKPVAIKENFALTEQLRYAFTREAKLLANLRHRALPQVIHHFSLKDGQFLVMDFIYGRNLAEMLLDRKNNPFSTKEVLSWADTLLDVLNYLHNRPEPIVHGDIKPANLKLDSDGNLFLLDFGLAKGKAGLMSSMTEGRSIYGYSANYSSLEQILKADLDSYSVLSKIDSGKTDWFARHATEPRSDLFALGASLYHVLTGIMPPQATARAARVWLGQPDRLALATALNSQVPIMVSEVLSRAMSLEIEERYSSAAEMRRDFRDAGKSILLGQESSRVIVRPDSSSRSAAPVEKSSTPETVTISYGTLGTCESSVRTLSFSPCGRFIASGSNDNTIRLWDLVASEMRILGECDFRKSGYSYVSSVAFSPDGQYVASGSSDQTVRVWNTRVDEMRIVGRCEDTVCAVAFSPDGKTIASGSSDGNLQLWNLQTGEFQILGECDSAIWSLAFSPDGKTIATENGNKEIRLWNVQSGEVRTLETQRSDVWSVAFSGDGAFVASGSWDQSVRIWDVRSAAMRVLGKCDGVVRSVGFTKDGKLLCTGSDDNIVRVWNIETDAVQVLGNCEDVVATVVFSPDQRTVASGSWDNTIRLWRVP